MKMRKFCLVLCVALGCLGLASAQTRFIDEKVLKYDGQCFVINGKDTFIYSGAFHYFRCPQALWADRFKKIKDAGFNTVETYIPWNYHEQEAPDNVDDYSKIHLHECQEWIRMAMDRFGLNVIVRPGPYICAEWATGGFPQWLMKYKPADFKGDWLRSDDPSYLAWCRHWYRAVCRALERLQITRQPKGKPGIIMFQLENEYDYASGKDAAKLAQIRALGQQAYEGGIEVPFVTCWTKQARNMGPVMDTVNFYPRWNVESAAAPLAKLRSEQIYSPQMVMEMQGGWFSENGGKLAEDQSGITAAQITNLTLYCIENGVTALNYYMLFGGTTFGDWTPPNITTSYDYFAPIREDGALGEKYRAVSALGAMLKEYGPRLVRSTPVTIDAKVSDPAVKVGLRFDTTGARIFFVRNSSHTTAQSGEASIPGIKFHYDLEPFGSKILYLPKDEQDGDKGTWLPKTAPELPRPATVPSIRIASAVKRFDDGAGHGEPAQIGTPISIHGENDSQYVVYSGSFNAPNQEDTSLWIKTFGNTPILVRLNGQILSPKADSPVKGVYRALSLQSVDNQLEILLENPGYPNFGQLDNPRGLEKVLLVRGEIPAKGEPKGAALKLDWLPGTQGAREHWYDRNSFGEDWDSISLDTTSTIRRKVTAADAPFSGLSSGHLMSWYSMSFKLPPAEASGATRRLLIDATGSGFLYLNGHPLGRFWQQGPQREFYLPEPWLHYGKENRITICLRPVNGVESLRAAEVAGYPDRTHE